MIDMVKMEVKGENLIIRLEGVEEIAAFKGSLEIPINCIERVVYFKDLDDTEKEQIHPRLRVGGTSIGEILYGRFTTPLGLAFFATKKLERSVVIYVTRCSFPYKVVVVEVSDSEIVRELEEKLKRD